MSFLKNAGIFIGGFVEGIGYVVLSPFYLVGWLYSEIFPDKDRTGLAIFGMEESGKTTIFNYLRNENKVGATSVRELNEFEYKLDNGKTRLIKKGVDIGGGTEYIKAYYAPMLSDSNYDVCFFVFNSFKYLTEQKEQLNINARIKFIKEKNVKNKKIILIGSHFDKFNIDESKVRSEITSKVKDKDYVSLFSEHLVLMNLTDKRMLKEFFNKKAFK